ncbi:MAG: hypothetical protein ACRC7V_07130 [Lachnospiraceae bacterium]
MKKMMQILAIIVIIGLYTVGCANNVSAANETTTSELEKIESDVQTENKTNIKSDIDVDLTTMSSTLVYAEVYNMMQNPTDYIGKTVKLNGIYYKATSEDTTKFYNYAIISDAASCCAQGIEFIWSGQKEYEDGYLVDDMGIELVGVFGSYEEDGYTYYYIAVDDVVLL